MTNRIFNVTAIMLSVFFATFIVVPSATADDYHYHGTECITAKLTQGQLFTWNKDGITNKGNCTLEPGGLTAPQAVEIVRGCRGLNIVGGILVEVAPAYDHGGITATLAANLLYEMLCTLPGASPRSEASS